ncbi:ribonuclease H-like domain-containing protein [Pseudomarimonas salicorniae]|uniref:Ribonuclease H-like domain-containing protein n=1 Tax=Pseudomarimonas salicorniae TaxID=2933270 RepID=A0ABT0GF60_9GAMM|nr:ribonuclease H-like domain-containing protein [Lysobacter sp. CAU 1642]MCK7593179.1 ribonuclease H-like domain-containing protein [Lysobacter sp. CAU 1642]
MSVERLRTLYRQASGQRLDAPPPVASPMPALPSLNTLLRRTQRLEGSARPGKRGAGRLPGQTVVDGLQLIQSSHPQPACGRLQFDHAELGQVDATRLLAIDTETTGLAGGSGTRAFLIGAADWHSGSLRVRQLLLTSLAAEGALLDAFAGWLAQRPILLSYNGKCFDVPLLRTRMRLYRRDPRCLDLPHVDLLYGVRRRYRQRWENCRLATAERELLDLARANDLPGSEAPAAFRRWLRDGESEGISRAAEHNAQDLVSLMQLAVRLGGERATPW